ncbi:hypothetical protein [Chryseobacterium indologenes]|uniref:hypothetical protein n=1 Tax=Chryseobacterium indologenes TaxID=253 RepID=UPI00076E3FF3|nr:hypothetical protein [Chryseobacterium indologenes]
MKTRKLIPTANRRKMNVSSTPRIIKEYTTDEKEQQKPLFLVMQKVWFDQIERGQKTEEFRDGSDFYKSRLCNIDKKTGEITSIKKYKAVVLQVGYHANARRMVIEVKKIDLKRDFTIHLGKILERQNF